MKFLGLKSASFVILLIASQVSWAGKPGPGVNSSTSTHAAPPVSQTAPLQHDQQMIRAQIEALQKKFNYLSQSITPQTREFTKKLHQFNSISGAPEIPVETFYFLLESLYSLDEEPLIEFFEKLKPCNSKSPQDVLVVLSQVLSDELRSSLTHLKLPAKQIALRRIFFAAADSNSIEIKKGRAILELVLTLPDYRDQAAAFINELEKQSLRPLLNQLGRGNESTQFWMLDSEKLFLNLEHSPEFYFQRLKKIYIDFNNYPIKEWENKSSIISDLNEIKSRIGKLPLTPEQKSNATKMIRRLLSFSRVQLSTKGRSIQFSEFTQQLKVFPAEVMTDFFRGLPRLDQSYKILPFWSFFDQIAHRFREVYLFYNKAGLSVDKRLHQLKNRVNLETRAHLSFYTGIEMLASAFKIARQYPIFLQWTYQAHRTINFLEELPEDALYETVVGIGSNSDKVRPLLEMIRKSPYDASPFSPAFKIFKSYLQIGQRIYPQNPASGVAKLPEPQSHQSSVTQNDLSEISSMDLESFMETPSSSDVSKSPSYAQLVNDLFGDLYTRLTSPPNSPRATGPVPTSPEVENPIKTPAKLPGWLEIIKRFFRLPMAKSFLSQEVQVFQDPFSSSTSEGVRPTYQVQFKQVERRNTSGDQAIHRFVISNTQIQGQYYSLYSALPHPDERLTLVLAGRVHEAYHPVELDGGRVVLILAGQEEAQIASHLVNRNVDVFVLDTLVFRGKWIQSHSPQVTSFTARRVAAFELMKQMPNRKTFALIDDNIQSIWVSDAIAKNTGHELEWKDIYSLHVGPQLDKYSCIGFKENGPKNPFKPSDSPEIAIVEHGVNGVSAGFGQKIFFFNLQKLLEVHGGQFENLFPPELLWPQEDVFFQIFLSQAGLNVGHVNRSSMIFERVDGKSIAKTRVQSEGIKEEVWLNYRPENETDEIRKRSVMIIQVGIQNTIAHQKKKRQMQIESELKDISPSSKKRIREEMTQEDPEGEDSSSIYYRRPEPAASNAKRPRIQKEPATKRPTLITKFGQLDRPDHWFAYSRDLIINPISESLYDFQKDAVRSLGGKFIADHTGSSISDSFFGYYNMPTGTGKTLMFSEIMRIAQQNITGNIALIVPNLAIHHQTYERTKGYHRVSVETITSDGQTIPLDGLKNIFRVSSRPKDYSAQYAAAKQVLRNGGNILIFCEKSFPTFVAHRNGDLSDFSMIVVDEMHKISKDTHQMLKKLSQTHPTSGAVIGFSATPRAGWDAFGGENSVIYDYSTEDAVKNGYLVPWQTQVLKFPENEKFLVNRLADILRFEKLPDGRSLNKGQGIIYVQVGTDGGIAAANQVARHLNEHKDFKVKARAYHSQLSESVALETLELFKEKKIQVLIAVQSLREGFDAKVDYVFMTQKNLKTDDIIQMRGRALRLDSENPGKIALILTTDAKAAEQWIQLKNHPLGGMRIPTEYNWIDPEEASH